MPSVTVSRDSSLSKRHKAKATVASSERNDGYWRVISNIEHRSTKSTVCRVYFRTRKRTTKDTERGYGRICSVHALQTSNSFAEGVQRSFPFCSPLIWGKNSTNNETIGNWEQSENSELMWNEIYSKISGSKRTHFNAGKILACHLLLRSSSETSAARFCRDSSMVRDVTWRVVRAICWDFEMLSYMSSSHWLSLKTSISYNIYNIYIHIYIHIYIYIF